MNLFKNKVNNSEKEESQKRRSERSYDRKQSNRSKLFVYITVLFGIAFFLILLSYLIQLRDDAEIAMWGQSGSTAIVLQEK